MYTTAVHWKSVEQLALVGLQKLRGRERLVGKGQRVDAMVVAVELAQTPNNRRSVSILQSGTNLLTQNAPRPSTILAILNESSCMNALAR